MHAFFKPVLILILVIFLFSYAFSKSNTLETTTEQYTTSSGMPQQRTKYIFHWDRFGTYVKETPQRISAWFSNDSN